MEGCRYESLFVSYILKNTEGLTDFLYIGTYLQILEAREVMVRGEGVERRVL